MLALINILIEQSYLIFALLIGLAIVSGFIKDKMNLYICLLAFVFAMAYFFYAYSTFAHGWVFLAVGVLAAALVLRSFLAKRKDSVELYSNSNVIYMGQWLATGLAVILLVRTFTSFMVGPDYRETKEQIHIEIPLQTKDPLYIIDGGYGSALNSTFEIQAKKYAMFIAGKESSYKAISPCGGTITKIKVEKTPADKVDFFLNADEAQRFGTSIVIKCYSFEGQLILSNLDPATIAVKEGQSVETGDPIAQSGHSEYRGRSGIIVSAVHSNATDNHILYNEGAGVPVMIGGKYYAKSDRII